MKKMILPLVLLAALASCKPEKPEPPQADVTISTFTTHAKGGESITITGSGFSATSSEDVVKINNVVATVTAASATSLTVTVPSKAGSGKINVTVKSKSAASATDFTYDWVYVVSTIAGSGQPGSTDATGTNALFSNPQGIAIDESGNLFINDYTNYKVRKITPQGVVSTFAGSGQRGDLDATGTNAQFGGLEGIVADTINKMIYVSDYNNHKIKKVTYEGIVTTFAGDGNVGTQDGTGTLARFNGPDGIAVDNAGNIFVVDFNNHNIRKITPQGVVTIFAGSITGSNDDIDATGTNARFNSPEGITIDKTGNMYVSDHSNHKIKKITPAGAVTTFAGSGTPGDADGTGTAAQFRYPNYLTIDAAGNLYVADGNYKVRKITPQGVVTTIAGSTLGNKDDVGTLAQFGDLYGITIDKYNNLYVVDYGNNTIRKITPQ